MLKAAEEGELKAAEPGLSRMGWAYMRVTVMRRANRPAMLVGAMAVFGGWYLTGAPSCRAADRPPDQPADVVTGAWQHHKVNFSYIGYTSHFTCDGLEERVQAILLHLGARKDARVVASGCPGPIGATSRTAWVDADFYTLVPVDNAGGSDTVKASWTPLEVTPKSPRFMGDGDCELVQSMKDLIIQNFSLRDIEYRTDCVPHQLTMDGFAVKGQVLRTLPVKSATVKG
jgi:hypothetical protein